MGIVEVMLPRARAFPHDPAVDGNGVVFWVDSDNSFIGRFDPMTNVFVDWPTPTPNSYPHGLAPDSSGHVWYTGNRVGLIGDLDPATGKIVEHNAMAADPHTPVFHKGAIWFTAQNANKYGRLNPTDGSVQVWDVATPRAKPYGMWPAPDGTLWIALFGTNKIAQLNPESPATLVEVTLPAGGARPRRIAVDLTGNVYYTDHDRGFLGRWDPATKQHKEWASPGGARSNPYGIAVGPDQRIYYNESGADAIVAFSPTTEKLDVIPIPTKGSVVRNITVDFTRRKIWLFTRRKIWLGLSGVSRLAFISVP
jgi:virginiamycin B lyase